MTKVQDYKQEMSEFELQYPDVGHFRTNTFGKGTNTSYELKSNPTVLLQKWLWC